MRLLIIIISTFLLSFSEYNDKVGFYKYCDGYELTYIDLKSDNSFKYYFRSCTGVMQTKGNWKSSGDTIFLNHNLEKADTFIFVKNQLTVYIYKMHKDFRQYNKMKIKNTKNKKDCCKSCYDRQKKS